MPLVICVTARKGGTGKTALSLSLAGLWSRESRVLLMDLDPQGSLTRVFFPVSELEKIHPAQTTRALFDPDLAPSPNDLLHKTRFPSLMLVPSSGGLSQFNSPRPAEAGQGQHVLHNFIQAVADQVDLVMIDTGPDTSGLLVWAALRASNFVLCPIRADTYGAHAISHLQLLMVEVTEKVNPGLRLGGYLINLRRRTTLQGIHEDRLRQINGNTILTHTVPQLAAFEEMPALGGPITLLKPKGAATKVIELLGDELLTRFESIHTERKAAA